MRLARPEDERESCWGGAHMVRPLIFNRSCRGEARTWLLGRQFFGLHDLRRVDIIGVYMILLERNLHTTRGSARSPEGLFKGVRYVVTRNGYRYALWVVLAFFALQPIIGVENGLDGAGAFTRLNSEPLRRLRT